jgi:hypothetical protein
MNDSDFTPHELAYIKTFEEYKTRFPLRDVSVFQQPITTREQLLDTIYFRRSVGESYNLASFLRFTEGKGLMTWGRRRNYYSETSYPFSSFKTERDFSDALCGAIANYIPHLKFPSVDPVIPKESMKDDFLRHYERSIGLLLQGPPHANKYLIDEEKKEQWIAAQKTEERKRLARLLVEHTIYISHLKLLQTIEECVRKVQEKLTSGPVTFIVATPTKSNYYIALLFYHYWNRAGLPLDFVKTHMNEFVYGNLIDIDEMAYSGTQTTGTLANVYGKLVKQFHKELLELNQGLGETPNNRTSDSISFAQTINFLPVALAETYLAMKGTNYIVLRIFCSEEGLEELKRMPPKFAGSKMRAKPPFYLIIGQVLPSPPSLFGQENADKLSILFGHALKSPAAPVYFNHKIANLPSTYLFPLTYGVVPHRVLKNPLNEGGILKNEELIKKYIENLKANAGNNTETVEFLPFLRYCGPSDRLMPSSRKNLLEYEPPEGSQGFSEKEAELPQEYRCPYAWYKGIDYETGTYANPPPLPKGGRRKRPTRKHRKQHKVSTRKH